MRFLDILATANRNLTRSKLRTLLTILAIFVGGFTLTLTTALNTGANEYLQRQIGNVAVPGIFQVVPKIDQNPLGGDGPQEYNPDKKQSSFAQILSATLTNDDVDKLKRVEGIERVDPFFSLAPEYIIREGTKKYQVTQLQQNIGLNLDLAAGRLLKDSDNRSVVLPEDYLGPLNLSAEEAVGKSVTIAYRDSHGKIQEDSFNIVGVMRKTFVTSGTVFLDVTSAQRMAEAQGQGARFIALFAKFKDVTDKTDENVLKDRLKAAGNYTATSLKERIGTLTTIVNAVTAALNVVGIIALLAASFGIINTLLMSVYERTQEIGLMKALGMSRRKVFTLFAVEAALVGFWGSAIAVLAAEGTAIVVNNLASQSFLKDFEGFVLLVVNPMGAVFVIGLIMLIAFLAGTLPAIKASRLNPIEALRSE
jgi:putative ABC transport system permease protein